MIADPFEGLPRQHFACIYADPPWDFRVYSKRNRDQWASRRDVERFYDVMSLDDVAALPVSQLAAPDAHLFLWTTGPHLPQALRVMAAWGFAYSGSGFVWIKTKRTIPLGQAVTEVDLHLGLGFTTRKNAEFVLLGRRGKPHRVARDVREVVLSPLREHSRKPDEVADRIERYCGGPYLELFARNRRENWTAWGEQVDHFDEDAA